ncbi:hypothetical protein [Pseudescherichia vulneris]|uniref:hypothetical protein n=1 Tax=Pseudescherichia vulneris TaxID=566 RepID=UPI0028A6EE8F|nr:hypothetical protein [Pseudescherichia vulneris]
MYESKLEEMYGYFSENMRLRPLAEIRSVISNYYRESETSRRLSFVGLGDIIEFGFVKKMLYASDFKWGVLLGLVGTVVFLFHLINDGIRTLTIGSFHCDMVFTLVVAMCLLFSSYPFFIDSFNCNMQEILPRKCYVFRITMLLFIFIVSSSFIAAALYFLGLTRIEFY